MCFINLTSLNRSLELDRLWPLWLGDDVDTLVPDGLLKDCIEFEWTVSFSPPSLSFFKSKDDKFYTFKKYHCYSSDNIF